MSRPASLRAYRVARGKQGGQKLGLNLEKIEPSNNHNQRLQENQDSLRFLRQELILAEREGRWSKARKIRRFINEELEVELYLSHSWCYGCNNVLHNCQCKKG